jgi:hypothetical protein
MKQTGVKLSLIVGMVYFIVSLFGSIFLVTWGSSNVFKTILLSILDFPLKWDNSLIKNFLIIQIINSVFWGAVTYTLFWILSYLRKEQ